MTRLGDVCRIVPGYAFNSKDWQKDGIPVIKIKNIQSDCTVDLDETDCVPESILTPKMQKFALNDGDILLAMTGATAGKVGKLRTNRLILLNQRVAKIEPFAADKNYIWSIVSSQDYQSRFFNLADGAAQPNMSGSQIEGLEIPLPPPTTQTRIAGILSAYDDLIENNTRRIQILERMAQALYREWFVHFRFPGHAQVKLVASPLGKIPQGWTPGTLGDIAAEVRRGVSPDEIEPETPYIGLEHIPRKSIALSEWGTAKEVQSTKLAFKKGEILFGKIRPYFHKVGVAVVDGVCSTDAIVIVPKKPEHFALVLACVSSEPFVSHATQTSQGTKMPRANWDVLTKYPQPVPPAKLLSLFSESVNQSVSLIENLVFKNRNLRRTRDLLLPRLLSGQVELKTEAT
jgi:type I restriction enzyme S subunit